MKNNNGFTLVGLLAGLLMIGIFFGVVIYLLRGTFSATESVINNINDNEIFNATENYVLEQNISFNQQGFACVTVQELIDYGYLTNITTSDKLIKITKNTQTKVIEEIKYVEVCE